VLCHVCRDFSPGLEIRHDLDGTCAVLDLEQKLVQNIETDVATKCLIMDLKTQDIKSIDRVKALKEKLQGLQGDLETARQRRTMLVEENHNMQSNKNGAIMQRGLLRNNLQAAQEKIKELEEMIATLTQQVRDKDQATASLHTENEVLQKRLRESEQANAAQNEVLAELQEDKHVVGLKLAEKSQAFSNLQLNWQSLEDRLKQAQLTLQKTISTYAARNEVLAKEVQQLGDQLTTRHEQEKSHTAFLRTTNQFLAREVQQLQRQIDVHQQETPIERDARLLRTENADIEKLRASIEQAKLDTEKQKVSLGERTVTLKKLDAEYKKLTPAEEYTVKVQKQKGQRG
jgi:chromosome segregation ATPase